MLEQVEAIIQDRQFYHVVQPLYELERWRLFGFEVLLRCDFFENPELLFQYAMNNNKIFDLDTSSIYNALSMLRHYKHLRQSKLFVNIFPSTLVHPSFQDFLLRLRSEISFPSNNLIFELNEAEKVPDMKSLKRAVSFLKELGYTISVDDIGKGESSIQAIIELEPDYICLDNYFSYNLSASETKQRMVQMLVDFCQKSNIQLLLEGIEDPKDLAMAKVLGVCLGQGYLLGRPLPISEYYSKEGVKG